MLACDVQRGLCLRFRNLTPFPLSRIDASQRSVALTVLARLLNVVKREKVVGRVEYKHLSKYVYGLAC